MSTASNVFGQNEEDMTLEEKLAAIEEAMNQANAQAEAKAKATGQPAVPVDPASLTICDGCE